MYNQLWFSTQSYAPHNDKESCNMTWKSRNNNDKLWFREQYLHKLALLPKAVTWPKDSYLYHSSTVFLRFIQMEAPAEWLQLEEEIPRLSSRSQQAVKNDRRKDTNQKDICLLSCKYDLSLPNLYKKFQMSLLAET